ncbi:hypothetical protein GGR92_003660 [Spirosoma lacussanchae]|uniref:hypothetical protein n=1 Tax=Spirosoma lacussanchae TaxID=1884249 RepID=UPI001108F648|nr:hypothetical protein [Spirosoma lacussanchae]
MALNLNETATLSLKLNNGDVSKSIDELNDKAKALKKTINEIEKEGGKGSENWQKYKSELKEVQTATSQLKKEVDLTTLNYGQLESVIKQLNKDLRGMKPGTEEFIAATKRLGEAEKQFKGVKEEVDKIKKGGEDLAQPALWQKIGGGVGVMAKAFQAFMALQVIGFIIDIGKSIFETTSKFEKYGKVLDTALGSQKEAQQAMAALKDLGAKTAFSVDELTDGYVKMINRGLRPSQKEMVAMTDLAASQGKQFDQLVEAALDAQTGEFERLKEFGIKASKEGDNVTLSFKGLNQTVKNTPEAINGAITAFGEMEGVAGQNAKMMETLDGKASNMGDSFDSLKVQIGNQLRPVFLMILDTISNGIGIFGGFTGVLATVITAVVTTVKTLADFAISSGSVFKNTGLAIKEFLSGNFEAAGAAWDQTKAAGLAAVEQVKTNVKTGAAAVVAIWSDPGNTAKAQFAGQTQGKAHGDALTSEQKKALEAQEKEAEKARKKEQQEQEKALAERAKANEAALKKIADTEAEIYLASVKGELQQHTVKLMQKRDKEAEAILNTVADEELKNQQIKLLDEKLVADIQRLHTEHRQKELAAEAKAAQERLQANNQIREQERQANLALLDLKELQAAGNARKLIEIERDRANLQAKYKKDKLDEEEQAELAKASRDAERRIAELGDVKDKTEQTRQIKDQLAQQVTAINNRFRAEEQVAEASHSEKLKQIELQEKQQRQERRTAFSNSFKALLDGDLMAFAQQTGKIVSGEQEAWQKRMQKNMESYDQVADLAKQGVAFLNKLTQERLDKEIAASKKETETKVADSQKRMEEAIEAAEKQAEAEKLAAGDSAEKIAEIEEKLATSKAEIREQFESEADDIRKDGADKEKALAKQKWEADKRAQVATALISGAQAALKALASGIFPVNLVFAGIIAGLTAVQIAKIKSQPAPVFEHGGFVARGGRHGSEYGRGGIALVDRQSQREVGEMEGDEAIISREQTAANWPLISRMFRNARTPGRRSTPVLQDRGPAFREGGLFTSPYWKKEMYLFGSKKAKREAEAQAREAEAAAKRAEAEAQAAMATVYDGATSGDAGDANGTADAATYNGQADAQAAEAAKMAQTQLELLENIGLAIETMDENIQLSNKNLALQIEEALALLNTDVNTGLDNLASQMEKALEALNTDVSTGLESLAESTKTGLDNLAQTTKGGLDGMAVEVGGLKGSINAVEGATREVRGAVDGVQGAVWSTNQAGRLDALIGAISSFAGK